MTTQGIVCTNAPQYTFVAYLDAIGVDREDCKFWVDRSPMYFKQSVRDGIFPSGLVVCDNKTGAQYVLQGCSMIPLAQAEQYFVMRDPTGGKR